MGQREDERQTPQPGRLVLAAARRSVDHAQLWQAHSADSKTQHSQCSHELAVAETQRWVRGESQEINPAASVRFRVAKTGATTNARQRPAAKLLPLRVPK